MVPRENKKKNMQIWREKQRVLCYFQKWPVDSLEPLLKVAYVNEKQNKNTRAKMAGDVKLFVEYLEEKHEQRNPEDIKAKIMY